MHPDLVGIILQKILSKTHLCLQLLPFLLFSVLSLGQEWELFRAFLFQPVWEALSHLLLFHQAVAGSTTFTEQKEARLQSLAKRGVLYLWLQNGPSEYHSGPSSQVHSLQDRGVNSVQYRSQELAGFMCHAYKSGRASIIPTSGIIQSFHPTHILTTLETLACTWTF